jgi:hypothetical protein
MTSIKLLEAVAVTAELCGRTFSEPAARVFVADLSAYPENQVLGALKRCRKEVKGLLTVHDVVSRLDDGRPGVEEAWAMVPRSESETTVWTTESGQAFGVAVRLLDSGDEVAARMAFKETYLRMVAQAREAGEPVQWHISLGWDKKGRDGPLLEAIQKGRIKYEDAQQYLPAPRAESREVAQMLGGIPVLKLAQNKAAA